VFTLYFESLQMLYKHVKNAENQLINFIFQLSLQYEKIYIHLLYLGLLIYDVLQLSGIVKEFVSICNVTPHLKVYIIYRTELTRPHAQNFHRIVGTAMAQWMVL
jgi:hypothetical protein